MHEIWFDVYHIGTYASICETDFIVAEKFALRSSFWAGRGGIDQFWRCHQADDKADRVQSKMYHTVAQEKMHDEHQ